MKKVFIIIPILLIIAAGAYWWFFMRQAQAPIIETETPSNPFPFSTTTNPFPDNGDTGSIGDATEDTAPLPKLRNISTEPIAGYTVFENEDNQNVFRYMLKNTGHIFEGRGDSNIQTRLSNTTLSGPYRTFFTDNGNGIVAQFITDRGAVDTFIGSLVESAADENEPFEVVGTFTREAIDEIAVSPDTESLLLLTSDSSGAFATITNSRGEGGKVIFTSPLREWNIAWPENRTLSFTTKAAANAPGAHRLVNTQTGTSEDFLGTVFGLTTLVSADGERILYNRSAELNELSLYALNTKTGNNPSILIETLPEKCIWSEQNEAIVYCAVPWKIESGGYPDVWYRGIYNFTDVFWSINIETGRTTLLFDPLANQNLELDAIELSLDSDESHLYFINKTNNTFWSLEL